MTLFLFVGGLLGVLAKIAFDLSTHRIQQRRGQRLATAIRALRARILALNGALEGGRPDGSPVSAYDWQRAGGGSLCTICGLEYRDHPADPVQAWITIRCDGSMVKL